MASRLKYLLLACVCATGIALPFAFAEKAQPPKFQPTKFLAMVDGESPAVRSLTVGGLSLIFRPTQEDPEAGEDGPSQLIVQTTAKAPGLTPAVISNSSYPPGTVPIYAVVKLDAKDPVASLLVQAYTGGAHCCNEYSAIVPVGDALKVVPIGLFNGGPLDEIPTDLDGDGRVDIAVQDDRFLYEFAPYYASWAPPMFLNVVDGEVVDVSTRPAFRKALDDYAADALKSCEDLTEEHRNGACAVYVAIKARQGAYAQALKRVSRFINREALDFLPVGCAADTGGGPCPDDMDIRFEWFEDALDYHLKRIGYLPKEAPSKPHD